ncbi:unnamed protein product [Eruca vesicaria subsp. sativa]|uniref:Uncharacterized protein n=1 Tax=Eruca vesicaria subsp. sativa TaxID=29727 RepID=A0ABC8M1P3_ERUVS|nr:unnamed protein product [Eruca vesicaria subsp. sativa]
MGDKACGATSSSSPSGHLDLNGTTNLAGLFFSTNGSCPLLFGTPNLAAYGITNNSTSSSICYDIWNTKSYCSRYNNKSSSSALPYDVWYAKSWFNSSSSNLSRSWFNSCPIRRHESAVIAPRSASNLCLRFLFCSKSHKANVVQLK